MDKLEIQHIRTDFPILEEKVYNKDLIYFDNGATTQNRVALLKK